MTTVIIDPTAAGSLELVEKLSAIAETENRGEGIYFVAADVDEVSHIASAYPFAVLKVEG